jgi:multiple sugar transport system permease protein
VTSSALASRRDTGNRRDGARPEKTLARRRSVAAGRGPTLTAFVAPSVILLLLLNAYPLIYAIFQSLHNGTLLTAGPYVGLSNFTRAFSDPLFWGSVQFTLIFTAVGVFGSWAIGLALALLMRTRIPGTGVFKVLLLLPWVVPIVVSATSWNWLVATPSSPIPVLAHQLGFGTVLFLANPALAAVTVCLFKVWVSFPFMMLMSSAALSAVDATVYEAARMDGASRVQQFRYITAPLTARSTYISWVLMTIFCVNDFPTVFLLTGGGPLNATTTLVVLAYQVVFQNFQTGYGVAIAFLMTIVLIAVSVALFRQIRKAANN